LIDPVSDVNDGGRGPYGVYILKLSPEASTLPAASLLPNGGHRFAFSRFFGSMRYIKLADCYLVMPCAVSRTLSGTAIRPSACPMAQLPYAIGTLAACSLAMCGLRTRPWTDVDPPRVEIPSAGGISPGCPRGDNLLAHVKTSYRITSSIACNSALRAFQRLRFSFRRHH